MRLLDMISLLHLRLPAPPIALDVESMRGSANPKLICLWPASAVVGVLCGFLGPEASCSALNSSAQHATSSLTS